MSEPVYAVGDIHGHLDKLKDVHSWIAEDAARLGYSDPKIIHIGDLVDRGPDSKGVIDYMISGHRVGRPWITLKGNHDRMFEWFLEIPSRHDPHLLIGYHWLHDRIGGIETLMSYGVEVPERARLYQIAAQARTAVPDTHTNYLRSLPLSHRHENLLFVHAGIRPGVPLDEQDEEDLVWIRDEFQVDTRDHGALIIHGHTPISEVTHYGNRINIDTGAAYGKDLSAIVIEGNRVMQITSDGRTDIRRTGKASQ